METSTDNDRFLRGFNARRMPGWLEYVAGDEDEEAMLPALSSEDFNLLMNDDGSIET